MAKLVQWVKKAVGTILDPDRDEVSIHASPF